MTRDRLEIDETKCCEIAKQVVYLNKVLNISLLKLIIGFMSMTVL